VSSERPRWYRRRLVIVVGALVAALACAAAVFALTRPGDVFNPDVEFVEEPSQTSVPTPEPEPATPKNKRKKQDPLAGFQWPTYGYSKDRRRYLPTEPSVRPPFKVAWSRQFDVLLEFPPIIVGNRLYTVGNAGVVVALNRTTGRRVWRRDLGYLAASSPAYGNKRVYVTILERSKGVRAGRVAALNAKTGKIAWSRPLRSRSESSPLFVDGRIYFGAEDGTVYAMRANDGSTQWTFRARGAVKGGPALNEGKLYFGTYGGHVYAITQRTGKQVWHTGTSGANFGLSAGNFYASPAVAYGRVYIGNTDGNMYSFSAASGKLAWRRGTGSYVYASPAVAQVRDSKPTVYFGSYDGTFYALDARSGATRWTYRDGGKISGAATVVGDVVYYSNWGKRDTTGLWARSGKKAWHSERGAFNPVVSDGQTVFVTGFSSIGAFLPKTAAEERATAARQAAKLAKAKAAKKRKAAKKKAAKKRKAAKAKAAKKRRAAKRRARARNNNR
jgi:outer membrane protein assembly factor BamB